MTSLFWLMDNLVDVVGGWFDTGESWNWHGWVQVCILRSLSLWTDINLQHETWGGNFNDVVGVFEWIESYSFVWNANSRAGGKFLSRWKIMKNNFFWYFSIFLFSKCENISGVGGLKCYSHTKRCLFYVMINSGNDF